MFARYTPPPLEVLSNWQKLRVPTATLIPPRHPHSAGSNMKAENKKREVNVLNMDMIELYCEGERLEDVMKSNQLSVNQR